MTALNEIPGMSHDGAELLLRLQYPDDFDTLCRQRLDLFDEYERQVNVVDRGERQLLFNSLMVVVGYCERTRYHDERKAFLELSSKLNGITPLTAMALYTVLGPFSYYNDLVTVLRDADVEHLYDEISKIMELSYDMAVEIGSSLIAVKSFLMAGRAPRPGPWGDLKGP